MLEAEETFDAVARIIAERDLGSLDEADALLDQLRAEGALFFRVDQFRYALCRARLAAVRGHREEAAAFGMGALWRLAEDEAGPQLPRHPDVGRVPTDQATVDELWRYAETGDAERYDALVDDYRSPETTRVQWHWSLVERLRPNPTVVGLHHAEREGARRAAEPLLLELREAGYSAYELSDFARARLPSKEAATILVKWLGRIGDSLVRSDIASALAQPKARSVATHPLLELLGELPNDAREKDRVAAAVGTLARDKQFDDVAALIRDPAHGTFRHYLFWAVSYMKNPAAVDLCMEFVDDPELGLSAVRSLGDLRSRKAQPLLRAIASEPTTRDRSDEAQYQRDRVRIAAKGLDKFVRAEAKGKERE